MVRESWRRRGQTCLAAIRPKGPLDPSNRFLAIEVKNAETVQPHDVSGLLAFKEDYPEATPLLVYRGHEQIMFHGVKLVPAERFLSEL